MTADVPGYPEMVRAAARDLRGDVEQFECWRVRLEYPIYHSTCRVALVKAAPDGGDKPSAANG